MDAHVTVLDPEGGLDVLIHPAPDRVVEAVLAAPIGTGDGRSPWMFLRLPNGDLMIGVFPQGDTYMKIDDAAQYAGPRENTLWCEQCGERPQVVHTTTTGLCAKCAATIIDEKTETA